MIGALLLAGVPLLWMFVRPGYFTTHDSDFHLIRQYHFNREIEQGNFPVRLVPALADGYGYAAMNYFYPLPYLIAYLFSLLSFSLGESLKLVMVLSTLLSLGGMYYWLRQSFSPLASALGTFLYLYVPYRMLTLYVTGQLGGAVAMALLPWILVCLHQVIANRKYIWAPVLGVVGGGVILAHVISVFMFLPFCLFYALLLWYSFRPEPKIIWRLAGASLLAMLIASFYVLPAFWEAEFVKLGHQVLVNYEEHWPTFQQLLYSPWGYGYSMTGPTDGLSFQVGLAQWAVVGLSALRLSWLSWRRRLNKVAANSLPSWSIAAGMWGAFALSIGLMLPASKFVWQLFPFLQYLQYSWRLLALPMVITGWLAAWLANQHRLGKFLVFGCVMLAMVANRNYLRTSEMIRYPDEHYLERAYLLYGSTDISWEALPVAATKPPGPAASLVRQPQATVSAQAASRHQFSLATSSATTTVLNLLSYPNWQIEIDGAVQPSFASPEGLVAFELPAGEHQLTVTLISTPVEQVGNLLTVIGLLFTVLWSSYEWQKRNSHE